MAGFNLPPGVSVSDIPGNRPEDEAYDRLVQKLDEAVSSGGGYAHNRVSAILRMIDKEFGADAANDLIEEFDLTTIFGIRKRRGV